MIYIATKHPEALLEKILEGCRNAQDEDGHGILTWDVDQEGNFRHITDDAEQDWSDRGTLIPRLANGKLQLKFVYPDPSDKERGAYGVYHGRFVELLINHFSAYIDSISIVDTRKPAL